MIRSEAAMASTKRTAPAENLERVVIPPVIDWHRDAPEIIRCHFADGKPAVDTPDQR